MRSSSSPARPTAALAPLILLAPVLAQRQGSGAFADATAARMPLAGEPTFAVASVDVDGDLDVVFGGAGSDELCGWRAGYELLIESRARFSASGIRFHGLPRLSVGSNPADR